MLLYAPVAVLSAGTVSGSVHMTCSESPTVTSTGVSNLGSAEKPEHVLGVPAVKVHGPAAVQVASFPVAAVHAAFENTDIARS